MGTLEKITYTASISCSIDSEADESLGQQIFELDCSECSEIIDDKTHSYQINTDDNWVEIEDVDSDFYIDDCPLVTNELILKELNEKMKTFLKKMVIDDLLDIIQEDYLNLKRHIKIS